MRFRTGILTLASTSDDHFDLASEVTRVSLNMLSVSASPVEAVKSNFSRVRAIRKEVLAFSPDVVISFVDQLNILVLLALLGTGLPVIVSERVDPRYYRIALLWRVARRLLYPRAARLVVQTESIAEWARGVVTDRRVCVIPNPVPALRDARSGIDDRFVLGAGRLVPQKGFDLLLKAFAHSSARVPGYKLVILGDGPEKESLLDLAHKLKIADRVIFPGVVTKPEDWMERASLFVLPSRYEGFPNVLMEAMAMGCAVIAADCPGGPRDLITDGENGILVSVDDAESLAVAMTELLTDQVKRRYLADQAVKVRQRFSLSSVIDKWTQLFLDVTARSNAR